MHRILAIGINTFREAVRDRILYGVLALASAVLVFTLALAELSLDQQVRVMLDVGMASISLFSVVIAVFLGSSLLYKEIERKTLYVILPKAVHRWEFLVGKFAGIALTAGVFVAMMGAVQLFVMGVQAGASLGVLAGAVVGLGALMGIGLRLLRDRTAGLLPWATMALATASFYAHSAEVPIAEVWMALLLALGEVSILTAVALLFSSFSTPFLTGGFTFGLWLVGRSADSMLTMRSRLLGPEIKGLLRGLAEVVPNFNLFVPGRAALAAPEAWGYVGSSLAYAGLYSALLLGAAALIFRRRDFL